MKPTNLCRTLYSLPSFLPPVAQVVERTGRVQYLESLSSSPFGLYLNILFRKALKTFIASNSGALLGEGTSVNSYHLGWEEGIPSQENEWVREWVNCQLEVWSAWSVDWKGTLPTGLTYPLYSTRLGKKVTAVILKSYPHHHARPLRFVFPVVKFSTWNYSLTSNNPCSFLWDTTNKTHFHREW